LLVSLCVGTGLISACSSTSTSNQAPNAVGGEVGDTGSGIAGGAAASTSGGSGVGGQLETGADVGGAGAPDAGSSVGGAVAGAAGAAYESNAGAVGAAASDAGGAGPSGAAGAPNPVYGYCAKPCGTVADCCPAGAPDCPSNHYPNNYACVLGACRAAECATTEDCKATNPKTDCMETDGFASCGLSCASDDDCQAPQTCSGTDDHGKKFCLAKGTGCSDDDSCHGYGKCVDKLCVCESALDCDSRVFSACAL
jgi:hypothetical protein